MRPDARFTFHAAIATHEFTRISLSNAEAAELAVESHGPLKFARACPRGVRRRYYEEFIELRLRSSHLLHESRENYLCPRDVHSAENTSKQ